VWTAGRSRPLLAGHHSCGSSGRYFLPDGSLSPVSDIIDLPQTSQIKDNPNTSLYSLQESSELFATHPSTSHFETPSSESLIADQPQLRVTCDAHLATASSVGIGIFPDRLVYIRIFRLPKFCNRIETICQPFPALTRTPLP
jgi:hypothetical protein